MLIRLVSLSFVFLLTACGGSHDTAGTGGGSGLGGSGGESGDGGESGFGGEGGNDDLSSWEEDCLGDNDCAGVRSCTMLECEACQCDNTLTSDWTAALGSDVSARHIAGAPDGSVYVLLTQEPWVARYAAVDGATLPFNVRSTLDWARQIAVGGDGSVYVGGSDTFGGSVETVQVQQLSPEGELLASARWPNDREATFRGMTTAADGTVHVSVLALAEMLDPLVPFPGLSVVRVDGDALVDPIGPFFVSEFSIESDDSQSPLDVRCLAVEDAGDLVFGADSSDNDTWLGFVAEGDAAGGTHVASGFDTAQLGGIASDGAGGWYWASGEGWTNQQSGFGRFDFRLVRTGPDGTAQWSKYFEKNPSDRSQGEFYLRSTCLVGLDDSVVLAVATNEGLEGDEPLALVSQFGRDGSLVRTASIAATMLCTRAGAHSIVLLSSSGVLSHVTFPAVEIELQADQPECTNTEVCEGGLCCRSIDDGSAVCASNGCSVGSLCSASIACVDSECLISAGESDGYCAQTCTATSECPGQAFCANGHCHASCTNSDQCQAPGTQCVDVMNAETQLVSICTEPLPASEP